jgi:hypothetical protein
MEEFRSVCRNPWCKAHFIYTENDMVVVKDDKRSSKIDETLDESNKVAPMVCNKCRSFDSELSGGVEWKDKEYEGSRFDGMPHSISYKVTNFKL